jgi:hypothetical protein
VRLGTYILGGGGLRDYLENPVGIPRFDVRTEDALARELFKNPVAEVSARFFARGLAQRERLR